MPAEAPLALVETVGGALRLAAVDARAAALGLAPGTTLADARARIPHLVAVPADTGADGRLLMALAQACERFTPAVALDPPDGLVLDVTGCAHLLGGEGPLHAAACALVGRLGIAVRASLAGTPDAARALARHGHIAVVPPGREEAHVRPLPVAALGVAAEVVAALARAGLTTIGDLADRPSLLFAARFGDELPRRLARALGREDARITPLRPPPACRVERHFPEPLTQLDGIAAALDALLAQAAAMLEARGAGGRRFEARVFRSDGVVRRLAVETGRPERDPAVIARLFRERLAALADPLDPGFGFDAVRLAVPVVEPLAPRQVDLDGRAREEASVAALLDRMAARFGRDRVIRFAARDTHDPDREARRTSALAAPPADAVPWRAAEPGEPPARPLQLFQPPQPIEVIAEVPDGPPARFRWRRVLHEVARAEGPERIAPAWWREGAEAATRDYYRIEDTDGRRFWIFRRGLYADGAAPRWFLHGLFA